MTTNSDFEITNGKIKLPYNFNDEKYIIGIEKKSNNTLMAGKTIIPIRDSKPSYTLEITPKTYPTFYFKKSEIGDYYELVKNEVFFNVNFIMDEIPLTTSDYEINVDWKEKYAITKTNLPKEIKLTLSEKYHKINSGDTHYDILEQNNNYSDRINITLVDENSLVYSAVLEIVFQKSYFETISKYDSIDISERSSHSEKKNVITIDGYYNDNKIDRNDLEIKFYNEKENDIFTSLVSTMKYANIVKGQNEFYLAHRELSKSEYEAKTPLHDCIVVNDDIYRKKDGKKILLVSDKTLYNGSDYKIIDISGNVYNGTTKLIVNSGKTTLNEIEIDNSGNTLYRSSGNRLIDIEKNVIKPDITSNVVLSDLGNNKIYSNGSGCTYNFNEKKLYSGTTSTLILDASNDNYYVPCYESFYDFSGKTLFTENNMTLYDNDEEKLYVSGNTNASALTINPQYNIFKNDKGDIIEKNGKVNGICGFTYNISTGEIGDIRMNTTIVTVVNSYNTGTTTSTTTGYTFNFGYTSSNGYYVNNINGSLNYKNGNPLLISGQTIYTSGGTEVVKYTSSNREIKIQLYDGTWIKFSYGRVTGYTTSASTTVTFTATTSSITNSLMNNSGGTYFIYNSAPNATNWSIKKSGNTIYYKLINGKEITISSSSATIPIDSNFSYDGINYALLHNNTIIAQLDSSFSINYITLGNNYYYLPSYKAINYNSIAYSTSDPQVDLDSFHFNNNVIYSGQTQIIQGVVKNKNIDILNLQTGVSDLGNYYKYHYKKKKLFYSISNTLNDKNIICDFTSGIITKNGTIGTSGTTNTRIVNLDNNSIVNYNGQILVDEYRDITLADSHKFNIYNKTITNSDETLKINFENKTYLILSGNTLSPFKIKYDLTSKIYNIFNNNVENWEIKIDRNNNKIIFNHPNYDLTATTESKITKIKSLNVTIDKQNYSWNNTDDIKCSGYTITNENEEKNFYYCDEDGNICFNGQKVIYVIDKDEKYYDLNTGKQVILQDGENFIDTTTLSILPEKKFILDKYNNIKLTKGTSYDLINKVEKDNNDKVITGITGESFTINDIFSTVAIDFKAGNIFDSNNRLISDISGQSVIIEGGLTVSGDSIYSGGTELVSGITNSNTIGLTSYASKNNVTFSDGTVYYRNKKAYSVNEGGFYFEKKINELFSTGFTLSNGLEITPMSANYRNSGERSNYSKGVIIKKRESEFEVHIEFLEADDSDTGGGGIHIDYNENDDKNPGFTTDENGDLIYDNLKIISIKDGQLLNPRDPLKMKEENKWVNYVIDVVGVLDLDGGKVDTEIEDKNNVYYYAHRIDEIKKNIPDLISYMFKQNKSAFDINIEATYIDAMSDIKSYALIEGGNNNSSYEIKVEPQFITSNMITNGSTVIATIVNNNGDHIDHDTYDKNNYKFTYSFDGSSGETEVTEDTLKITLSTGTPIFNEIKFSLKCDGKLVKQEIVEVLGENKFITSTEYINNTDSGVTFKITETANTYYNTTIKWGIEKELTGVSFNANSNTLSIPSGVTGTVILSGTCNNIKVYEKAIVITKNGDKGEKGETGETGPRGKLLYPAGRWNSGATYDGTDVEKTPFVTHKVGDEDKYFVLTASKKTTGRDVPGQSTAWTEMVQYEALYTKLLVAENGLVGGSVYNGDYVFSKNGITANGETTESYSGFTIGENFSFTGETGVVESGVELTDLIFKGYSFDSGKPLHDLIESKGGNFIPNYLVDFSKGRAWFGNGSTRILENGTLLSDNIIEVFNTIYLPHREKKNGPTNSAITNASWDEWKQEVTITEYDDESHGSEITLTNVFYKYVSQLNSLIVDHPNINTCMTGEQNVILKLSLMDESIAETNKWYKGVIYMAEKCTLDTRTYLYIGENVNCGASPYEKYFEIYPGEKIEYLYKWSGEYTGPTRIGNTDYSTGGIYSCKIGDIIVFSNKTNRWKITKLENRIKQLEALHP